MTSGRFFCRERFEVAVDLLLIIGRRLVLGAGGQPVARLARLQLLRERRFGAFEGFSHLLAQRLPPGKVLLEGLGAWRGQHHALPFEGDPRAALGILLIVAPQLVEQFLRLLKLLRVFLTKLRDITSTAARASSRTALVAVGLLTAR